MQKIGNLITQFFLSVAKRNCRRNKKNSMGKLNESGRKEYIKNHKRIQLHGVNVKNVAYIKQFQRSISMNG